MRWPGLLSILAILIPSLTLAQPANVNRTLSTFDFEERRLGELSNRASALTRDRHYDTWNYETMAASCMAWFDLQPPPQEPPPPGPRLER